MTNNKLFKMIYKEILSTHNLILFITLALLINYLIKTISEPLIEGKDDSLDSELNKISGFKETIGSFNKQLEEIQKEIKTEKEKIAKRNRQNSDNKQKIKEEEEKN